MRWLLPWLWQGLALAALAGGGLRLLPRTSAATRHAVWWIVLGGVLALPAWSAVGPRFAAVQTTCPPEIAGRFSLVPFVVPSPPEWVQLGALCVWLVWAGSGLFRVVRSLRFLRTLARRARPLPVRLEAELHGWLRVRGAGRRARLAVSDEVATPLVVGLGPALIVLPPRAVAALAPDELDQVVLHEHAHVARRDDWTRLAEVLVAAVAGWHPAVRAIGRAIAFEREAACDEAVVAAVGSPRRYARGLVRVAALAQQGAGEWIMAPSAARGTRDLRRRVARILAPGQIGSPRVSRRAVVAATVALAAAGPAIARAGAPVVFGADRVAVIMVPSPPADGERLPMGSPLAGRASARGRDGVGQKQPRGRQAPAVPERVPVGDAHRAPLGPGAPTTGAEFGEAIRVTRMVPPPLAAAPLPVAADVSAVDREGRRIQDAERESNRFFWTAVAEASSATGARAATGGRAAAAAVARAARQIAAGVAR